MKDYDRVAQLQNLIDSLSEHPYACSPVYIDLLKQAQKLLTRRENKEMENENIRILKFDPNRKYTHPANKEKGWESLGSADVGYYGITIACNLIRGKNTTGNCEYFYFLELPCARFIYKGAKGGRWVKRNFVNFETNEESLKFQNKAFAKIVEDYPQLFDEVFLEQRKKLKEEKKAQFNSPKARNKSKFEKEK